MCKGSCRRKPTEGLFFYNPSTTSWSPSPYTGEAHSNPSRRRLQACFAHSQIPPTAARFPNPSRRRLQACFAHSQIPLHKGAKNTPFQSTRAAGAPFLFDFLSSFFSPLSGLSFLKNAEIFIIFFVGARLSLTTPRFGAII